MLTNIYDKSYGVWCVVSGGITGHREAWLKANGEVILFDTADDAEAEAHRLTTMSNTRHSTTDFSYSVREYR